MRGMCTDLNYRLQKSRFSLNMVEGHTDLSNYIVASLLKSKHSNLRKKNKTFVSLYQKENMLGKGNED